MTMEQQEVVSQLLGGAGFCVIALCCLVWYRKTLKFMRKGQLLYVKVLRRYGTVILATGMGTCFLAGLALIGTGIADLLKN